MVSFLSSNLEHGSSCEYFMKNAEGREFGKYGPWASQLLFNVAGE